MNMNKLNGLSCENLNQFVQKNSNQMPSPHILRESEINIPQQKRKNDQTFSLNDIYPEDPYENKRKHKRIVSENLTLLKPQYLFSLKSLETLKKPRKSLTAFQYKANNPKKFTFLIENDTNYSTRSNTSHCRRFSDYEANKSLSHTQQLKNKSSEEYSCKLCSENTIKPSNEPNFESKILEFFNYFLACWKPLPETMQHLDICEECGKEI